MIGYVPLKPGPGFSARRAALYYAQRLAIQPALRRAVAHAAGTVINARFLLAPLAGADLGKASSAGAIRTLRQDGIALLNPLLSASQIQTMRAYLGDKQLILPSGKAVAPDAVPPDVTSIDFPLETVLGCPHVLSVANDPRMLNLARRYIGCRPTISSMGLRWSFPGNQQSIDTQRFHRDPDDWRFVKLFIYLTDVTPDSGPHVYVHGTHRLTGAIRSRLYSEDEMRARYGEARIHTVTGPAGTSFVADTYGIHKGRVPTDRPRLMLTVGYSMLPIYAFRYEPVTLTPRPQVDRYVNRLILA